MGKWIRGILLAFGGILFLITKKNNDRRLHKLEQSLPEEEEKLLPMERIWQRSEGINRPRSACGPTSAAMVTKYFVEREQISYPILSDEILVNEMYRKVISMPFGTHIISLQIQLMRFLNEHSEGGKWRVKFAWANRRYAEFVQSIEQGNPVIIHFLFNKSKKVFASHHYVVGVGYRIKNDRRIIGVLDPDAGKHNRKVHWIDWEQNEKWMNLLFITNQST